MEPERLADVIINSLQFNAFLVALLFGAQGFALGRIWPEGQPRPRLRSAIWLVPGFGLAVWCLVLVAEGYMGLTQAIGRKELLVFSTRWMENFWHFYGWLAGSAFFTTLGAVLGRRT